MLPTSEKTRRRAELDDQARTPRKRKEPNPSRLRAIRPLEVRALFMLELVTDGV